MEDTATYGTLGTLSSCERKSDGEKLRKEKRRFNYKGTEKLVAVRLHPSLSFVFPRGHLCRYSTRPPLLYTPALNTILTIWLDYIKTTGVAAPAVIAGFYNI